MGTSDYVPGGPGTGRQPAPMNAPQAPELSIGVQPGTPNIIRAFQVIVSGTGSGIFVYSPTVGAGNLVASLAANSGTDPFGNFYPAGLNVGKISSGHTHINTDGSIDINNSASQLIATIFPADQALLFYSPGGGANTLLQSVASASGTDQFGNKFLSGVTTYSHPAIPDIPWIATQYGSAGLSYFQATDETTGWSVNDASGRLMPGWTIGSGGASAGPEIDYFGAAAMTLLPINTVVPLVASDPNAANITPEPWHTLGGGLGIANLSSTHGRYRLTPEGRVEIDIVLTATGAGGPASGAFANNMVSQYQPSITRRYGLMSTTATGPASVLVGLTGTVTVAVPAFTNGNVFGGTIIMPTD